MFKMYLGGVQQDLLLASLAPIICAIFRFIFIKTYRPKTKLSNDYKRVLACYRFGFWWGLDFNAYLYLALLVLVTLPISLFGYTDNNIVYSIKVAITTTYLLVLYIAFIGKMIFYKQFNDIYNPLVLIGKKANKMNLIDAFFNQYNGYYIIISIPIYIIIMVKISWFMLQIPVFNNIEFNSIWIEYIGDLLIFLVSIAIFYWFRYGGSFDHGQKPELDKLDSCIKEDIFLAKATIDDLVALEIALNKEVNEILTHDQEESVKILNKGMFWGKMKLSDNPFDFIKRTASGHRIKKPSKIFFIVGESYCQAAFDNIFSELNIVTGGKKFIQKANTIYIKNFLPAGLLSKPAISSLMSGLYESHLEINERAEFINNRVLTALPYQLKKLGYNTYYWYGGPLSSGNMINYAKAMGFDRLFEGKEICDKNAPSTWLGVYDHIFLENVNRKIESINDDLSFHFIYTTSNHTPFTIPINKYGWNKKHIGKNISREFINNKKAMSNIGTFWYADKAMFDFIDSILELYEDSLVIVTGDHARIFYNYDGSIIPRKEISIREKYETFFAMYHREFNKQLFEHIKIGGHLNIMPTIIESIAEKGFEYYSIEKSLYENIDKVVTPDCWLDFNEIGYFNDKIAQDLVESPYNIKTKYNYTKYENIRNAQMELTAWAISHSG